MKAMTMKRQMFPGSSGNFFSLSVILGISHFCNGTKLSDCLMHVLSARSTCIHPMGQWQASAITDETRGERTPEESRTDRTKRSFVRQSRRYRNVYVTSCFFLRSRWGIKKGKLLLQSFCSTYHLEHSLTNKI